MKMLPIDIVGGSSFARYSKINAANTVNMMVSDDALIPYPGYAKILEFIPGGLGEARGLYHSTLYNHLIVVVNQVLFTVDDDLAVAAIGTLETQLGPVDIAENGNSEIALADGEKYYVFDYKNNTFKPVDIGFIPTSLTADNRTGFIFAAVLNSNQFRYSEPNNASSYPIQNAGAIGDDKVVGVQTFGAHLYVFGSKETQKWDSLETAFEPWHQDPSVAIQYGALANSSIASGFNYLCWVASSDDADATIMVSRGGVPVPLSTDGIDFKLGNLKAPEDCVGFIFQEDGHVFYQVTFTTDELTLVYDFQTRIFIELTDEKGKSHLASAVTHFHNRYYFVSRQNSNLYEMGTKFETYDGAFIPRERVTRTHRFPGYPLARIPKLELVIEQVDHLGLDPPHIDLSLSKDGGVSFGKQVRANLSPTGDRRFLMHYWNLGMSRDWVFRFQFWGKTRFVIISAFAQVY